MVIDWYRNATRILSGKRLYDADKWDRRMKRAQEVNYLRFLIQRFGASRDFAWKEWRRIENGTAKDLSYDEWAVERAFDRQWKQALALSATPLPERLPDVDVTFEELAYLDSLDAPIRVKQYWLDLLVVLKTKRAMGERLTPDKAIESYLMDWNLHLERADAAFRYVNKWSLRCGVPFPMSVSNGAPRYVMPDWAMRGSKRFTVSLSQVDALYSLCGLLDRRSFHCPKCGGRFAKAEKAKTDLCGKCYEARKAELAKLRKRKQREKHRS